MRVALACAAWLALGLPCAAVFWRRGRHELGVALVPFAGALALTLPLALAPWLGGSISHWPLRAVIAALALAPCAQALLRGAPERSEAAPDTIRRACKVHPIAALQTEYSLWSREPEDGLLALCRELGVGFVAYSPLGRGFLTGHIKSPDDFEPDDTRRMWPRFQGENFQKNLDLVKHIEEIAIRERCTPAQLALAWVLAQGNDIVPIPGTKHRKYLEENFGALEVRISADDLRRIDEVAPKGIAVGARYPQALMGSING